MHMRSVRPPALYVLVAATLLACSSENSSTSSFGGSSGAPELGGGSSGSSGGGSLGSIDGSASSSGAVVTGDLEATIRDFRVYSAGDATTNADFENIPTTDANGNPDTGYLGPWDDRNIVEAALGADGKPVYAHPGATTVTTHGQAAFDQWFRSVPGTNIEVKYPIHLTRNADGSSSYDSAISGITLSSNDATRMFFPIDDGTPYETSFGNEGDPHNYSFTVEMHTVFTYHGGEFFRFRGDDDVFVFINGKRVVDLGGIHGPEETSVNIDSLGLTAETVYPLDFFFAERHRTGSNVLFSTSLGLTQAPLR
jgi:fibro-slime domain-containing protein